MSDDEPEMLPPTKHSVPAKREESRSAPTPYEDTVPQPTSVLVTALTGFQARWQARTYQEIAKNIRAQKDALDAETSRRDSTIKLLRKTGELHDIKDILALDRAERAAERAAKYAGLTGKYEELDDDQDERAHQRRLAALRRQREIEEANAKLAQAQRGTFIEKQGLMDAEKAWLLLRRELDGMKSPQQKAGEGNLEQLLEMRASLVQCAQEAAAQRDASKAERYTLLAAELDKSVIAAMRGEGQK
jgi:hypothetical protein